MKIGFYTQPGYMLTEEFGCRTQGFPDSDTDRQQWRCFEQEPEGVSFTGSYRACLDFAAMYKGNVRVAILLLDSQRAEQEFLDSLADLLQCPVIGGRAAWCTHEKMASLCLLTGHNLSFHTEWENIHQDILEECELELKDVRTLLSINGIEARQYLRDKKAAYGLPETDFEHMTLSTPEHINAHLSLADAEIISGRDLQKHMLLRCVNPEDAQERIERFFQGTNSIVFGCAGLKGILKHTFACENLGSFLHGEICPLEKGGVFGNLMLSKLVFE